MVGVATGDGEPANPSPIAAASPSPRDHFPCLVANRNPQIAASARRRIMVGKEGNSRRRRRSSEDDRISGLPDELLQDILVRLRCARAAARTSVLSRRWRHLWAHLPELVLAGDSPGPDAPPQQPAAAASFPDVVDGALDAHAAPTLDRLLIAPPAGAIPIPAARAAPWLRFAAERVAGALLLLVPPRLSSLAPASLQELELPACARAQTITLKLQDAWLLRPAAPAGGVFTALTSLTILYGRMEGSELSALVSTRCPCLRDLKLCLTLADTAASDSDVVSIRSGTLRSLWFCIWSSDPSMIEVVAPRLEKLCAYYAFKARFLVPKLSELVWTGDYASDSHQFVDVSRRLQLLDITPDQRSAVGLTSLLQKFDEVDELRMIVHMPRGTAGYESFLNEISKLPKCMTLKINLERNGHGLAPSMFHLLRSCTSAKNVSVRLLDLDDNSQHYSCPLSCSCRLPVSCRVDDITLGSLEEVEIGSCTSSHEELEFVELLSICNAPSLKHLIIYYYKRKFGAPLESKEICKKIRNMYGPNVEVEFYVVGKGSCVCFDWREDLQHVSTKC